MIKKLVLFVLLIGVSVVGYTQVRPDLVKKRNDSLKKEMLKPIGKVTLDSIVAEMNAYNAYKDSFNVINNKMQPLYARGQYWRLKADSVEMIIRKRQQYIRERIKFGKQ